MKKSKILLGMLVVVPALMFTSCKSDVSDENAEQEKMCMYEYNSGTTTFEWTAYKFTDKSGAVPGTFDDIEVEFEPSEEPKDVIESISFKINTAKVNSQNEDRDKKIAEFFFKTINTQEITGKFKSLKENGKAVVEIVMNGIAFDVEGDYTLNDADFTFEAAIDVLNWNGMAGIEALNTECLELHRKAPGEDSKLWSEVNLKLSTKLKSDC
ncbi:MAG: YceI family protein [Bacteroidetes bacterium]|nr:MAG: YceI family protein [Bacteroidota bacterium]